MMTQLPTWRGRSEFSYQGSVRGGTEILYGKNGRAFVTAQQYEDLLQEFLGRTVPLGTHGWKAPPGSIGNWLCTHVTSSAIACYVGPILLHEGYARRGFKPHLIRVVRTPTSPRRLRLPGL